MWNFACKKNCLRMCPEEAILSLSVTARQVLGKRIYLSDKMSALILASRWVETQDAR